MMDYFNAFVVIFFFVASIAMVYWVQGIRSDVREIRDLLKGKDGK